MKKLFLLSTYILFALAAWTQSTVIINKNFELVSIDGNIELYEDANKQKTIEEIIKIETDNWVRIKGNRVIRNFSSSNYWSRFSISNSTEKEKQVILVLDQPQLLKIQFFHVVENKVVQQSQQMGLAFPFKKREINHRYYVHTVTLPPNTVKTIYCKTYKFGRTNYSIRLYNTTQFLRYLNYESTIKLLLLTPLVLSMLISLMSFFFLKERFLLYYSLQEFFVLLFIFSNDGFVSQYLLPNQMEYVRLMSLSSAPYILFNTLFVISFFKLDHSIFVNFLLKKILRIQVIVVLGFFLITTTAINFGLNEENSTSVIKILFTVLTTVSFVLFLFTIISCVVNYIATKNKNILLFIIAIFLSIIGVLGSFISNLGLINLQFTTAIYKFGTLSVVQNAIIFFIILSYFYKQLDQASKLKIQLVESQNQALQNLLLGQEIERKRLSQEIHDGINLSMRNLKKKVRQLLSAPHSATTIEVLEQIEQLQEDIRHFSHDLSPDILEKLGFEEAVNNLIFKTEQLDEDLHIEWHFQQTQQLNNRISKHFYHILQELLHNTLKHAKAQYVRIIVTSSPREVSLAYYDDGVGFDATELSDRKGIGLGNIQSRAKVLNGAFTAQRVTPKGMKQIVTLNHF